MSNRERITLNNELIDEAIEKANNLPDAGSGGDSSQDFTVQLIEGGITEITDNRVTYIRPRAFYCCDDLTSINFPNANAVGDFAFSECYMLENVYIPNVTDIAAGAFADCEQLKIIDLPNVTYLGNNIFAGTSLCALILRQRICCSLLGNLDGTPISEGNGYVYVPRELIETYQNDVMWSIYAEQFRAIEDYTIDGTLNGEIDKDLIMEGISTDNTLPILIMTEEGELEQIMEITVPSLDMPWGEFVFGQHNEYSNFFTISDEGYIEDYSGSYYVTWPDGTVITADYPLGYADGQVFMTLKENAILP